MLDPTITERIRSIFLHHESSVTIIDAARVLGMSDDEIAGAIAAGDIETTETSRGTVIDSGELAEQALHLWSVGAIEEALGYEASLVLPSGMRTRDFTVRLPRYIIAALTRLADENEETVEAFLTRELHGFAYEHKERLARLIPGFAEAIEWPLSACGSRVC
jgi:hypothetical protein